MIAVRAQWARVLLAELERLYNHVGDLGNICAGIGFQPAVSRLGWLKERLLRLNDALTGHRYLTGVVAPGGLLTDLDPSGLAALPETLDAIGPELASAIRSIIRSEGVMGRFHGTGVVSSDLAAALGALGVAARASGLGLDLRIDRPYAAYDELSVGIVAASAGDVAARFHVRAQEAHESLGSSGGRASVPQKPIAVTLRNNALRHRRFGPRCGRGTTGSILDLAAGRHRRHDRPAAAAIGIVCQLAGRRGRRARQPRARLPADQQELRALLRLHGSLTMPLDAFDRLLRPLRRGPVTSHYPDVSPDLAPAARGLPELDVIRCDGSASCVGACPTGAIDLSDSVWSIDAGACIFCGACARACPRDAIRLGPLIELAVHDRADLTIERDWRVEP